MHNIHYVDYDEKTKKSEIMEDIEEMAAEDGDGYCSRMTWHITVPPFETREEAKRFIEQNDKGWYDDHAVRYKDYSSATKTAKIIEYENKIDELQKAKRAYFEAHSIHSFQAKHIGCPKCESRLNKEYIVGNSCPLCRTDLRSKTTIDKLNWYEQKIADYRERIEAEKRKQSKNCKVMWLVKYEYHS